MNGPPGGVPSGTKSFHPKKKPHSTQGLELRGFQTHRYAYAVHLQSHLCQLNAALLRPTRGRLRIARRTDPPHALRPLLRARHERPRGRPAAEQYDELASPHSITSSARARSVGGTSRRSALAVVRLITRSNLVGCSTGRLAGFAPRKILSTWSAARRHSSSWFGP